MLIVKNKRGDTIIEVILAMTLLTLILFTSWGLVNRSTQASLAARQRIEMVNELKEQAEILKAKYAESQDAGETIENYLSLSSVANQSGTSYDDTSFCAQPDNIGGGSDAGFHFNANATIAENGKDVHNDQSSFVWLEYITRSSYTDFYVRGCWSTSGGQQKTDNSQFIVRLNK